MRQTITFHNEKGNLITINVTDTPEGISIEGQGPNSHVQHTWTPLEAEVLRHMLDIVPRRPVLNIRDVISGGMEA